MNADQKYLRAMVIDDEEFMRKLTARQLLALGCQSVESHGDGASALASLSHKSNEVDLIVCDLQMPNMDGIEVMRALGLMGFGGAVILVSGENPRTLAAAERLARAHGLALLGVLPKPVEPARLSWMLDKLALDEPPQAAKRMKYSPSAEELSVCLSKGQLVNHYQPKVCLRTGAVVGMEALVRWQHPELGLIYPDEFIPVAERSGLIDRLTRAVMDGPSGALTHLRQWQDLGLQLHMSVNVSMENLLDLSFPDFVMQASHNAGVGLEHVVLEITESRLSAETKLVADVLTRLRLKKMRLSIDDFGTGYSSLAQLHELPFDELKIDKRFVHGAHEVHVSASILDACLNMAKSLSLSTTGEGVECLADWQHLQQKGCDVAQGYWIAKPMPPERVPTWIAEWQKRAAAQTELLAQAGRPEAGCSGCMGASDKASSCRSSGHGD
jgi:EAL domain-containing protein (putative c-di-GMP-specific phosphodiesterase class I)